MTEIDITPWLTTLGAIVAAGGAAVAAAFIAYQLLRIAIIIGNKVSRGFRNLSNAAIAINILGANGNDRSPKEWYDVLRDTYPSGRGRS